MASKPKIRPKATLAVKVSNNGIQNVDFQMSRIVRSERRFDSKMDNRFGSGRIGETIIVYNDLYPY